MWTGACFYSLLEIRAYWKLFTDRELIAHPDDFMPTSKQPTDRSRRIHHTSVVHPAPPVGRPRAP
jgi:hypothetical protein